MAAITPLQFVQEIDKITAMIVAVIGSTQAGGVQNSNFGSGDSALTSTTDYGANRKARDLLTLLMNFQDPDRTTNIEAQVRALQNALPHEKIVSSLFNSLVSAVNSDCNAAALTGVTDIDTFANYYNLGTGGWWQATLPPDWRTIWNDLYSKFPTITNVYSPAIANMGQVSATGAGTVGSLSNINNVDTTKYAGAVLLRLVVTGLTGTGVVTVTGTNHAGTAGKTWTVTVTANGTYDLVATSTGDLLTAISAIGIAAGISAGTFQVVCAVPYLIANMAQWNITGAGTGTLVAGTSLPPSNGNGVANPVLVTSGMTGTLPQTATVTGVNQNGVPGRTWTVSVTGNGDFALSPTTGGDLLQQVTGIAIPTVTAGTLIVAAQRSNPPV